MSKYTPLADFLRSRGADEVPMTFAEIEQIIGAKLPPSSRYRAWWSNNDFNSVMTKAWLDAGFQSEQVDMKARKLIFRRVGKRKRAKPAASVRLRAGHPQRRHPLFGALKGLLRIAVGTDLTTPADPAWGAEK